MKRLTVLCIVAFVGLILFPAAVFAGRKPKPVEIVNPLPLPVTGDINATVTGDAMNPIPVTGVSEPMQHDLVSEDFIVPDDRLLIIKYVSAHCQMRTSYYIPYSCIKK